MSWFWRVGFLLVWIVLIAPIINEGLTSYSLSLSRGNQVNEGLALLFGAIQSVVFVIGFIPIFLKWFPDVLKFNKEDHENYSLPRDNFQNLEKKNTNNKIIIDEISDISKFFGRIVILFIAIVLGSVIVIDVYQSIPFFSDLSEVVSTTVIIISCLIISIILFRLILFKKDK